MSGTTTDPFATAIAAAKAREAEQERLRQEEAAQAEAERLIREAEAATRKLQRDLHDFGRGFLCTVVTKVVRPDWPSSYIALIQEFSEGLLSKQDKNLPQIARRYRDEIMGIFAFGLELAPKRGIEVPEDFFYGQRLLKQKAAESSKAATVDRIKYVSASDNPAIKPPPREGDDSSAKIIELKPAVTPPTKKGRGQHRKPKPVANAG